MLVIWREYFDDAAVAQLTETGTLPREETEIEYEYSNGKDIAAEVARVCHDDDSDAFIKGGDIVILEPEKFAGRYKIYTDYEPTFSAVKLAEGLPTAETD